MWTPKTLIRLGRCPGWSESLLGAHAILLVLSWGGSNASEHNCYIVDPDHRLHQVLTASYSSWVKCIFEPRHDKTNKVSVRPAKTQISLGIHPVWSVFAVCMKKAKVLSYPLSAQRRLIRLGRCPGWPEPLLGAHSLCWFCHVAAHFLFLFMSITI